MTTNLENTARDPEGTARLERVPLAAVVLLGVAGFISVTTELMPSGLLTAMAPDLGTEIAPAGALTAAYAIAIVITVLPLTKLTLRMRRRTVLMIALLAFCGQQPRGRA